MKRVFLFLLAFIISISTMLPVFANGYENQPVEVNVGIYVNGISFVPERQPVSISGRVLLPARSTFEGFEARVDWFPDWGQVNIFRGSKYVHMNINST